jgi:hypothetical protein
MEARIQLGALDPDERAVEAEIAPPPAGMTAGPAKGRPPPTCQRFAVTVTVLPSRTTARPFVSPAV